MHALHGVHILCYLLTAELDGPPKRGREGFWAGAEPKEGRDCAYVSFDEKQYYQHAWSKARCNAAMPFLCETDAILAGKFVTDRSVNVFDGVLCCDKRFLKVYS